jgi:hypothetical protein
MTMTGIFLALFFFCAPLARAFTAIDDSNFHAAVTTYVDDKDVATSTYGDIMGACANKYRFEQLLFLGLFSITICTSN